MIVKVKSLIYCDTDRGYYEPVNTIICDSMEEADEWARAHYTEEELKDLFLQEANGYDQY